VTAVPDFAALCITGSKGSFGEAFNKKWFLGGGAEETVMSVTAHLQ
jgi:hypothetical protein